MENITKIWLEPMPEDSRYVRPCRFFYVQNGQLKNRDLLKIHDGVLILIYHTTRQKLVFVRQFRPAVFYSIVASSCDNLNNIDLSQYPPHLGVTTELCSGMVDKDVCWKQIAHEELLEECGYYVPIERIEKLVTYRMGVGVFSSQQILYYCEVTDEDKQHSGGGVGDELIEVVEHSIDDVRELTAKNNSWLYNGYLVVSIE